MTEQIFHFREPIFFLFSQIENAPEWLVEYLTVLSCGLLVLLIPTILLYIFATKQIKTIYTVLLIALSIVLLAYYAFPHIQLPTIVKTVNFVTLPNLEGVTNYAS